MKKTIKSVLLAVVCLICLSACVPKADFDVRGTWTYTMTSDDGNQYDIGSITFSGSEIKGNYTQLNVYDVEYVGAYEVSGVELSLTGYENWRGSLNSAKAMSGVWQHDDGAKGTFEAARE